KTPSKTRRSTRSSTRNTANGSAARPTRVEKKAKAPKRKALGEVDVQKLYPTAPSTLTSRSPGSIAAGPNKKPLAEKLVKIVEEDETCGDGPGFMIFTDEEVGFRMDTAPPSPAGSQC